MSTSPYSSPFASPASDTEKPRFAPAPPRITVSAAAGTPDADPRNRWAEPLPESWNGAPTITSEYESPFTSPAPETENPN
jgi:hypothetical protein